MTHQEKIEWMAIWCAKNKLQLVLEGSCGFGRECVGVVAEGSYPDYYWYDHETYKRLDKNGEVWTPEDAYHKHECVAVLGRGEVAEAQLYEWLRWFDDHGFVFESGDQPLRHDEGLFGLLLGRNRYKRMVKKGSV